DVGGRRYSALDHSRNKRPGATMRNIGDHSAGVLIVSFPRCRLGSLLLPLLLTTSAILVRPAEAQSPRAWDRFVTGGIDAWFQADPPFAVYQGRHEFDGRFPDWTGAGITKWVARLHALRDSASAFRLNPADTARTFERRYVLARIDRELFWVERADW